MSAPVVKVTGRVLTFSEAARQRNPHLFGGASSAPTGAKRIKQERGPLLNKLEADWLAVLRAKDPWAPIRSQSVRLRLANGAWYKPDHYCSSWKWGDGACPTAWECKGPRQVKGCAKGLLALKVAAHEWPEIRFVLVWREGGQWRTQTVLP